MSFFHVNTFLGGLALLLFGMRFLIDNLCRLSGGKLEFSVEQMTSSPLKGVLWGAGLTAFVQSSGVMTVSVVGLTNAGMIHLRQAIAVIMGANIGTTFTAWIFALTGVESGNLLFRLLHTETLSPLLAVAGVLMLVFGRSDRLKNIGNVMIGLAVMFFGMMLMTDIASLLAAHGAVAGMIHRFYHPLLYFAAGFLLTAFIQSSVTSIGFLQAISVSGVIPVSLAVPAVMGMEIGACVMALVSAYGTSSEAKQAAVGHLLFNSFGTVLCLLFYLLQYLFLGADFFSRPITMVGIAAVHSLFNIVTTIVLLPLMSQFEALVQRLAPLDQKGSSRAIIMEERFFSAPSFAAEYGKSAMMEIKSLVYETLIDGIGLMFHYDREIDRHLKETESLIDEYERKLRRYLAELSCRELTAKDGAGLASMFCSIVVLKRLSRMAVAAGEVGRKYQGISLSCISETNLPVIADVTKKIMQKTFGREDFSRVEPDFLKTEMHELKNLCAEGKKQWQQGLHREGYAEYTVLYFTYVEQLERIAESCGELTSCISRSDSDSPEGASFSEDDSL